MGTSRDRLPSSGALCLSCLTALAMAACTTTGRDRFVEDVRPVLEARCATAQCHGVFRGTAWPETEGLFFAVDSRGRITDPEEAYAAAKERIVTTAPPALSSLVRVPMDPAHAGGPHAGGALFHSPSDPGARAVLGWIASEPEGSGGEDVELTALEAQFGSEVLPVLSARCGRAGCHGPTDIAFTAFPAVPDPVTQAFAPEDIQSAHRVARKHLDLTGGHAEGSRLIRKALGPLAGGIAHRGGVGTLFPEAPDEHPLDAPGLEALLRWARAERAALGVREGITPRAVLFVRGPTQSSRPFVIDEGLVGSDLLLAPWPLSPGALENLSAPLHPEGPAEVRDPAVSHDGQTVVFAMRRGDESNFALYALDLTNRQGRRLTAEDAPGSFVSPVYGPDGGIVAAWDGHGEVGTLGQDIPPELVAVDPDSGAFQRLTWTPAPEVAPGVLATGKTRGMIVFGTRRHGPSGPEGVLFRFPPCHDDALHGEPEYHVQFGASLAPLAPVVARDLPDGRQVMVVLDTVDAPEARGRLAILDRSMGPFVPPDRADESSLGGARSPLSWLGESNRFRDPAVLPDGRILVASDTRSWIGEDALYLLSISDGPEGASLASTTLLLSLPGHALRTPVPVFARPLEDDGHAPVTDPLTDTATIAFRDVAVLEALYGRAAAIGARPIREDIRGVRFLAWDRTPARTIDFYADGGTTVGLSPLPPLVILGELRLPEDRSLFARVPARTPIKVQWLDERGMVVGNQLDRFYYAEGLETIPGGTNTPTYAHDCAGCHGSLSGDPTEAAAPAPDAISAASVTLSTHEDRNRRLPLAPVPIGETAIEVDFVTDVAPLLGESCAVSDCHTGDTPAADLALDERPGAGRYPAAYENLFVDGHIDTETWRARSSPLVERLLGEELEAPRQMTGRCPPNGAPPELIDTVVRFIETGAFYDLGARDGP